MEIARMTWDLIAMFALSSAFAGVILYVAHAAAVALARVILRATAPARTPSEKRHREKRILQLLLTIFLLGFWPSDS